MTCTGLLLEHSWLRCDVIPSSNSCLFNLKSVLETPMFAMLFLANQNFAYDFPADRGVPWHRIIYISHVHAYLSKCWYHSNSKKCLELKRNKSPWTFYIPCKCKRLSQTWAETQLEPNVTFKTKEKLGEHFLTGHTTDRNKYLCNNAWVQSTQRNVPRQEFHHWSTGLQS